MNWYEIRPWWWTPMAELLAWNVRYERTFRVMSGTPSRQRRRLIAGKWQ